MPEKKWGISASNVLGHELIGLKALVKNSTDESKIGLKGRIVMETRNTISIETNAGEKIIPKAEAILALELPDGTVAEVDGRKIIARPEDRTKLFLKKKGKRE